MVVHRSEPPRDVNDQSELRAQPPARVGFVVSRAVGPAVVRNRVKRRLRHLVRDRLPQLQPGAVYAVRATPASATASYAELGEALDRCLVALDKRAGASPGQRSSIR